MRLLAAVTTACVVAAGVLLLLSTIAILARIWSQRALGQRLKEAAATLEQGVQAQQSVPGGPTQSGTGATAQSGIDLAAVAKLGGGVSDLAKSLNSRSLMCHVSSGCVAELRRPRGNPRKTSWKTTDLRRLRPPTKRPRWKTLGPSTSVLCRLRKLGDRRRKPSACWANPV